MASDKEKELIIRHMSAALHRAFKLLCMQNDVTMNSRLIQLIKADVQRAEQEGKKKL